MESMNQSSGRNFTSYPPGFAVQIVLTAMLVPFTLLGNSLVIYSVVRFPRLQIPTNYFLVLLAVADIMVALILPFLTGLSSTKDHIVDIFACLLPDCCAMTARGVSLMCMTAVACDRYIAISHPLEYVNIVSVRRILVFCVCAWVLSAIVSFAPLYGWHDPLDIHTGSCSYRLLHAKATALLFGCLFAPAYGIIFFCYARIFTIARKHACAISAVEASFSDRLRMKYLTKDTKYAKTLGIVIGILILLWLPYQICILLEATLQSIVPDQVHEALSFLTFVKSGINPWIYAFKTQEFKAAFTKIKQELKTNFCLRKLQPNNIRPGEDRGSTYSGQIAALNKRNSRVEPPIILHVAPHNAHARNDSLETDLQQHDTRLSVNSIGAHCAIMMAHAASIMTVIEELPKQESEVSLALSELHIPAQVKKENEITRNTYQAKKAWNS